MTRFILPCAGTVPVIGPTVYVAPTAAVIGDVRIGALSSPWFGVVVRGDVDEVGIGAGSNVRDGAVIHVSTAGPGTCTGARVAAPEAAP